VSNLTGFGKPETYPFLAIACLAAVAVLLSACAGAPTPQSVRAREELIPPGAVKMTPGQDPSPPILHSDEWEQPVPLEGEVNTAGAEDSPFILPDGTTMYFFFTPDVTVPAEEQVLDGVTGIYVSLRGEDGWGVPERLVLQQPGRLALDGCPFVRGSTLWFCSAREGYTGVNHFTAQLVDGAWRNWGYAGKSLPEADQVGELHITADGGELYFHAEVEGGRGGYDLWVSRRQANGWGAPQHIETVNTAETEGWPFLTQDGNELWFTRFHMGSPAILRATRTDSGWSSPELIVSQFAGEPTLDDRGNIYFVHHFYRGGQMIEADIYVAYRREPGAGSK
jgi:hypothetical protein